MKDLPNRARRSGANVRVIKSKDLKKSHYGLVFCDAPCSGSGSWRRDPEGKWSLTLQDYEKLLTLQENILATASQLVKPNGNLVYATCSILKDENEAQIQKFLKNTNIWVLKKEKFSIPSELGDGFYFCILKRK